MLTNQQQQSQEIDLKKQENEGQEEMLGEDQSTSNNNFSTNGTTTTTTPPSNTDLNNGFLAGSSTNAHNNVGDGTSNGVMAANGSAVEVQQKPKPVLDRVNQDIVRLIGQHLKLIGLDKSAETLMHESGCCLEHPGMLQCFHFFFNTYKENYMTHND